MTLLPAGYSRQWRSPVCGDTMRCGNILEACAGFRVEAVKVNTETAAAISSQ